MSSNLQGNGGSLQGWRQERERTSERYIRKRKRDDERTQEARKVERSSKSPSTGTALSRCAVSCNCIMLMTSPRRDQPRRYGLPNAAKLFPQVSTAASLTNAAPEHERTTLTGEDEGRRYRSALKLARFNFQSCQVKLSFLGHNRMTKTFYQCVN